MAEPDKSSRTAKIMEDLRHTSAARQLMAMEASVAWPIPYRANNRAYLILPTYLRARSGDGKYAVFPWSNAFTLDWLNERLVEYVDFRFKSPWSSVEGPVGLSEPFTEETVEKAKALAKLYDELSDAMALGQTPPPFWLNMFREHLNSLIEPSHKQFYQHLAPKFYERFIG
jgi:hypothetical protein